MGKRSRSWSWALAMLCLVAVSIGAARAAVVQAAETQEVDILVRGRVLFPDGSPARGAVVHLVTFHDGLGENPRKFVQAEPVEVSGTGEFAVSYVPGPGYRCVMRAEIEGHEPIRWEWSEHPAQGSKTLPAHRFQVPCFVTGSIVGPDGELHTDGWLVGAYTEGDYFRLGILGGTLATPDPETGEFRIGPLAPGKYGIVGSLGTRAKTKTVTARIHAGEPNHVVLIYEGPKIESSISIDVQSARYSGLGLSGPFSGLSAREGLVDGTRSYLFLLKPDGSILTEAVQRKETVKSRWWFLDVPRGEYVAELRHPCFEPVRIEGVMTGVEKKIRLRGSAGIELEVLSSQGRPLAEYELSLRYAEQEIPMRSFEMLAAGKPAPTDGRFGAIVPGVIALSLKGAGGERQLIDLGTIEPGETRAVRAQLAATEPMEIRVIDADGKPAGGINVFTAMGGRGAVEEVEDWLDSHVRTLPDLRSEAPDGVVRTDSDGRAKFSAAVPGLWTLRARSGRAHATRTLIHPEPNGDPVILQLPAMGRLEGRLLSTEGFDWSSVEVRLWTQLENGSYRTSAWLEEDQGLDERGVFVVNGLAAGMVRIEIRFKAKEQGPVFDSGLRMITMQYVSIIGGLQQWELDLRPHLPVVCEATVSVDGKPYPNARVLLLSQQRMERYAKRGKVRQVMGNEARTNGDGRAEVTKLKVDQSYTAFVIGRDETWGTAIGIVEGAVYGDPVRLTASLELVEREVLVRSASGDTFPETEFGWASRMMTTDRSKGLTNSESKMTLNMPRGTYALYRTDRFRPKLVAFKWQAGEGPLVIELPEER